MCLPGMTPSAPSGRNPTKDGIRAPDAREHKSQPGDHIYNDGHDYSWISRQEMEIIISWLENLPTGRGKRFFVHPVDDETIAVVLIPEAGETDNWQIDDPASQLVLELRRGREGRLTGITQHTLDCAQRAQRDKERKCECSCSISETLIACRTDRSQTLKPSRVRASFPENKNEKEPTTSERPNAGYAAYALAIGRDEGPEEEDLTEDRTGTPEVGGDTGEEPISVGINEMDVDAEDPGPSNQDAQVSRPRDEGVTWEPEAERVDIQTYRIGGSIYRRHNVTEPPSVWEEVPVVRPFEESPEWDIILDKDGVYDENEIYPIIGRDDIGAAVQWIDSLPENKRGGKHFLIHKIDEGHVAFTLTRDDFASGSPLQIGQPVIELAGRTRLPKEDHDEAEENGREEPAQTGRISPYRDDGGLEYYDTPESPERGETDDEPETLKEGGEMSEGTGTNETRLTVEAQNELREAGAYENFPEQVYTCRTATCGEDEDPEAKQSGQGSGMNEEEEGTDDHESTPPENRRGAPEEAGTTSRIAKEIERNFPLIRTMNLLPEPPHRSNGVLAAQEIIPFARYNDDYEDEFYAKGVTLVMDDEDSNTTYYRGNALIRISPRDIGPGTRPPTRLRVDHARRRLFRTDQFSKEKIEELNGREADWNNSPARKDGPTKRLHDVDAAASKVTIKRSERMEMPNNELEAVITDLMDHPIKNIEGKRVYEIEKSYEGKVLVTRIPFDPGEWRAQQGQTEEIGTSDETDFDQQQNINDHVSLTELGDDPPASDHGNPGADAACETQNVDGNATPWDSIELNEPQPWWKLEKELEMGEKQMSDELKSIRETRMAQQGDLTIITSPTRNTQVSPTSSPASWPPSPSTMNSPPAPTPSPSKNVVSYMVRKISDPPATEPIATTPSIHIEDSDGEEEEDDIDLPPVPNPPRPGIVAATHLTRLAEPTTGGPGVQQNSDNCVKWLLRGE
jgi:hypothetical protein